MLLKKRQEEARQKELEETRKCEEEVAQRVRISAARAELELKHFEEKQGTASEIWLCSHIDRHAHISLLYHQFSHEKNA